VVVLDGSGAGSSAGLQIRCDGNEVYGLEIRNFSEEGILVLGSNNTIRENAIPLGADRLPGRRCRLPLLGARPSLAVRPF